MVTALFLLIGFVFAILIVARMTYPKRFREAPMRMTNEEFVGHCAPGTDPEIAVKVRQIVAKNFGIDPETIFPWTRFVEDLGAD